MSEDGMYSLKAYNYSPFLEYLKNTKLSIIPKSIHWKVQKIRRRGLIASETELRKSALRTTESVQIVLRISSDLCGQRCRFFCGVT
jgi:hypothetical protein